MLHEVVMQINNYFSTLHGIIMVRRAKQRSSSSYSSNQENNYLRAEPVIIQRTPINILCIMKVR